jgi:transposase-like protein
MTNKERRQQEWMTRIADYRASGLTMAAWCHAHSFSIEQLKYWIRKMKTTSPSPRFVPLTTTTDEESSVSSLIVHIGKARIELRAGFNPQLLREVVQALDDVPC